MDEDDCEYGDSMVIVAALVSRVEALVVASMLEAGGIFVYVGAIYQTSCEVNSVTLGGHRIWVPAYQHQQASELLVEVLGEDEWSFSYGLQRAVLRLLGVLMAYYAVCCAALVLAGGPLVGLAFALNILATPVNPQGRGDYYLHASVYD
ncbi:MAG: hypothetical protein H6918_02985 [Sphingomonadaceae bacterium]|nr:hypothetical protein [Sphingomonadaceae bacterium]